MMQTSTIKNSGKLNLHAFKNEEKVLSIIPYLISVAIYCSLLWSTSIPLIILTVILTVFNRVFLFTMLLVLSLLQGCFSAATSGIDPTTISFAETITIAAVSPFLLYDLITCNSKKISIKFLIIYLLFIVFIFLGVIVYYQHPENFSGLAFSQKNFTAAKRSILKAVKIVFYVFYFRVLINYSLLKNLKTLDVVQRCAPFIIFPIGIYLLLHGRVQNGVGYTGTLQLGNAHHGIFTSSLCALAIYLFITLFSNKTTESILSRIFSFAAIVMVAVIIMYMGSRNGLLCFVLMSIAGALISLKGKRITARLAIVFSVLFIIASTVLLSLNSPTMQRATYMLNKGGGDRIYYWRAALTSIKKFPLFGLGGDESASVSAVASYAPASVKDRVIHNSFLEVAVEYGLIATACYIIFVLLVLQKGLQLYKVAMIKQDPLIVAPAISFVILMFASLFISNVWSTPVWYNISLLFALIIQLNYSKRPIAS